MKKPRELTSEEIDELASYEDAKKRAVENFLTTVTMNDSIEGAYGNLRMDASLYRWNTATVVAISEGIRLAFRGAPLKGT